MKIVSIEPTPSPISMKLNMDESLPKGMQRTYTLNDSESCPSYIGQILNIDNVKSVFHTADFMSVEKRPKGDWKSILAKVSEVLGSEDIRSLSLNKSTAVQDHYGEAHVWVQMFRGIPMQIRVKTDLAEERISLPGRFVNTAVDAGLASANLIKERKLEDWGIRYGDLKQIADDIAQEIDAAYDDTRLHDLKTEALRQGEREADKQPVPSRKPITAEQVEDAFTHTDWKVRYAALERMKAQSSLLPLITQALKDAKPSIRRLAVVYLGDINEPQVLPYLYEALEDSSVSVRRTAGDTLSDIGNPAAIPAMIKALSDKNQLVRWRAARFLYEVGDDTAAAALRNAQNDTEFEVSMQARIALARIEGGKEAEGTVWQQMTRRNK